MEENKEDIKLTDKEDRFCYEYCIDFNATQAAIRAGYSEKTARAIGYENLTKPRIQRKISAMKSNLAETAGISALRVLKEHEKIAFSNAWEMRSDWMTLKEFESLSDDQKACIQEISTKTTKRKIPDSSDYIEEEFVKIKLYDKQKSLEGINRMLGFDAPVKNVHTGENGGPIEVSAKINEHKITFEDYEEG